jgi:hypothetical protein
MGRPKKATGIQETEIETEKTFEGEPSEDAEEVRPVVKKLTNVLATTIKMSKPKLLKKGSKVVRNTPDFDKVKRVAPGALVRITEDIYELSEDVTVMEPHYIKAGTILDPVKDKDLIAYVNANVNGGLTESLG